MARTPRTVRILTTAGVVLALSASAAQARPLGLVVNPSNAAPGQTAQTSLSEPSLPIQVTTPASSNSFDWTDAGVGAGAAAALLGLAGVAGTRVRRRPPLAQS